MSIIQISFRKLIKKKEKKILWKEKKLNNFIAYFLKKIKEKIQFFKLEAINLVKKQLIKNLY